MPRRPVQMVAGLIALYLVVEHYTGAGKLLTAGSAGATGFVKTLQGR